MVGGVSTRLFSCLRIKEPAKSSTCPLCLGTVNNEKELSFEKIFCRFEGRNSIFCFLHGLS